MNDTWWALFGVVIGILGSGIVNYFLQQCQFRHNVEMFKLENRSSETVKEILLEMLNNRKYKYRSLGALMKPIGGYRDDELRRLLHEIGGKKIVKNDGRELWCLIERESEIT